MTKALEVPSASAIYCRISDDAAGEGAGVHRQETDCRELAERRGWPVARVFIDNDCSAWRGRRRPEYEALLEAIRTQEVDALAVWHLDRLHRRPVELEHFFEVVDGAGLRHLASVTGDVDLSTDDGRFMARILGAVAKKESDDKSRRLKRKHLELAEQGRPAGGRSRGFGYEADAVSIRASEAILIRSAVAGILAGESVRGICAAWNAQGILTTAGGAWKPVSLRRLLMSPRVAGLRQLHDVTAVAIWPPIVDRESWDRLRGLLMDPGRRKNRIARRYLLTGTLFCALCGAKLVSRPRADKRRCYVCATGPGFTGCGKIRTLSEPVEGLVLDMVLQALAGPGLSKALAATNSEEGDRSDLDVEITASEAALEELSKDYYVDRAITRAEFQAVRGDIVDRLESARRRQGQQRGTTALIGFTGTTGHLRSLWDDLSFDRRRAVLTAVVDRVEIGSAVKGRNTFDPSRVSVIWRA